MEKLGTNYGGWYIPKNITLNADSIVYSGGVGEDISFDLLLSDKFDCNIVLIDPTKRAITHYDEVQNYYKTKQWEFGGDIQGDYNKHIANLHPNFDKISYLDKGLWREKTKLKFYKQTNPKYVSQSLKADMFGTDYYEVGVDCIKNIMKENNHVNIDLLKLDIEGAEIEVLNNMIDDEIYPKYLCIEFDLLIQNKDKSNHTRKLVNRLQNLGYKILYNDKLNITFKYV
jgi:FkbM family methyltransferase